MANYLDTRDLYKRQCELQAELDGLIEARNDAEEEYTHVKDNYLDIAAEEGADDPEEWLATEHNYLKDAEKDLQDWQDENQEELDELNRLEEEVGREWMHGTTLIPEEDFEDYAQDLAEDLGMDRNHPWPYTCIDWKQAADELRMDYSSCEYEGTTYLFRS